MKIPFLEGVIAGLILDDPRSCPFIKFSEDQKAWHRGHRWGIEYRQYYNE